MGAAEVMCEYSFRQRSRKGNTCKVEMSIYRYCCSILLFFFFVFCFSLFCQESSPTKIVRNSTVPIFKNIKYELVEDLEIGKEDNGSVLFYRVVDIEVDHRGSIYVLDSGLNKIHKFDKDGHFAGSFGGPGQGPGEFEMPSFMRINEIADQILVMDQGIKAEVFSLSGQHIKRISFKKDILDFQIVRDRILLCVISSVIENGYKYLICLTDETGTVSRILATYSWEPSRVEKIDSSSFVASFTGFEHFVHLAKGQNGFIYGHSKKYELTVFDDEFRSSLIISKDDKGDNFTAEEKRDYRKYNLSSHKPFFYGLFSDEEGRIYVQRSRSRAWEGEYILVDVFSREGDFLYKINLPRLTHKIRNGYLYAYCIDESSGFGTVKRMKISNWAKLPTHK
jgi:hypothetical protein